MSFALRLSMLAALFMGLFTLLGLRLWFIQVAEGQEAAAEVQEQQWLSFRSDAPRGDILDRDGRLLATSRYVPAVVVDRRRLVPEQRETLVQRLSALLEIPPGEIDAMYEAAGINGRFRVAVVDDQLAYRIRERLRDLPGVVIERVPERVYLAGDTMAHVIGHLGLPSAADLEDRPVLDPNLRIGKLGVERVYDEYLQGDPGNREFRVDRTGTLIEERPETAPTPGSTIWLTLDERLQQVVEQAVDDGVALANEVKQAEQDAARRDGKEVPRFNETVRAAAVVLDVDTFEVLAMYSRPDFDPQLFVTGIPTSDFVALQEQSAFLNLAVSGLYPPASTFKAITYVAADRYELPLGGPNADPVARTARCNGTLELPRLNDGSPQIRRDWYTGDKGELDIHSAFEQSCNIFFWSIALGTVQSDLWGDPERENLIQQTARELGYGSATGIDLSGEASGIVPDRELFEEWKRQQLEEDEAPVRLAAERLSLPSPWLGGDLMNLAIGQGEIVSTPLQVAVSYASLANGGFVHRPHVVKEIRTTDGDVEYAAEVETVRDLDLDLAVVSSLLTDLNRVVTAGTAAQAFAEFGESLGRVGGKTGTAQSIRGRDNHAWFVGVGPIDDPRWVVVVMIEEGGSGGLVAAPVARQIMQHLMGEALTPIVAGAETD
jgi:penicillin-binding protein 2